MIVFYAVDFSKEVKRGWGCIDIPIKIAHGLYSDGVGGLVN